MQTKQNTPLWATLLFNLILSVFITLLLTAPAISFLDSHVVGYPHDGFEYVFKMDWFYETLIERHISPANFDHLQYPYTETNHYITASPLIYTLSLPVVRHWGPLQTYNIFLLACFVLNWVCAAALAHRFVPSPIFTSVAGAVFAFNANIFAHAVGGHMGQVFAFLVPLSVLFLLRLWHKPNLRHSLLAGITFGLYVLTDLKIVAYVAIPLLGFFMLYWGIVDRKQWNKARLLYLGVTAVVIAVIVLPFLTPLFIDKVQGNLAYFKTDVPATKHAADLLAFFIPSPEHPLFKNWQGLNELGTRLALPGWHENIFFLGWATLALAAFAAFQNRKDKAVMYFATVVLIGCIFMLGPALKVNEKIYSIPLPYALIQKLPFYEWGRTPGRIATLVMLHLGMLAAIGVNALVEKIRWSSLKPVVGLLFLFLLLFEHLYTWPMPLGAATVPTFMQEIAADSSDYALLELPMWEYRCDRYQLYYAAYHHHPITGSVVSRRSLEAEESMHAIERIVMPTNGLDVHANLSPLDIRYVVFYPFCAEDTQTLTAQQDYVEAQLGTPAYQDEWITVYSVFDSP